MLFYKDPFPKTEKVYSVALGTFDGVHIGHRAVINTAVSAAKENGGISAVWCFDMPPRTFFTDEPIEVILSPEEKRDKIEALGVDILVMPDLEKSLLSVPAEEFLDSLYHSLHPSHVVVGFNYTFGAAASGDVKLLQNYFEKRGVTVTVIEPVTTDRGVPVSSTMIRKRIEEGHSLEGLI